MAKQLGRYFQLYIGNGASPEVFTVVAGQDGLTRDASSNLVDQSDKSNYPYSVQAPGRTNFTITVTGKRDLPDASGLELVYSNYLAQTAVNYQVKNTQPSPDTVVLAGSGYITSFSQSDADEDNGTYSFVVTPAAAPTTDDLTP